MQDRRIKEQLLIMLTTGRAQKQGTLGTRLMRLYVNKCDYMSLNANKCKQMQMPKHGTTTTSR